MAQERKSIHELARIRYDEIIGALDGGFQIWASAGRPVASYARSVSGELQRRLTAGGRLVVVDVREAREWFAGHIPGSINIPVYEVLPRARQLPLGAMPSERRSAPASSSGQDTTSSRWSRTATRAGRSHDDWPQEVKLLRRGSPNARVRSGEPNGPQLARPQTLATRGEQAQAGTMEAREREPTKRGIAARERRMRPSPVSRRARVPRPLEAPASEGDRAT
jgi:hypothetical protein